jgi:3-oxoacyl-[acyl-carrier-protein] synthase-1
VLVSGGKVSESAVLYKGGSSSNDANHISGPSRTGEGLVRSIEKTFKRSGFAASDIDFVSAHGTATVFNDEMESIAFGRTNLDQVPLNSMKGYFGHTLGAAGVLETIMSIVSMEHNTLFPSLGYRETGTSVPLNIIQRMESKEINTVLKTASGFGGGNASLILQKLP